MLILAAMDFSAGIGVFVGGATVQDAKSVDTGTTVAAIVFASVALVATGIVMLARRRRLQRARAFAR